MAPTEGKIFVSKVEENLGEFEVVGKTGKVVVDQIGPSVTQCKPGDYVIFSDYREYQYLDTKILVVDEDDLVGVEPCIAK